MDHTSSGKMMVEPDNREICPNKSVSVAFIGVSGLCEVEKSDRGPEGPLKSASSMVICRRPSHPYEV